MRKCLWFALIGLLLSVSPAFAQAAANPCDADEPGPFVIASAKSFTVVWCTTSTRTAPDGSTVPERIDGAYVDLDGNRLLNGPAVSLGHSAVTNRDAWSFAIPAGVGRGTHTINIVAWNFVLDGLGEPTTARAESAALSVPFSAVDPSVNLTPLTPTGGRIK
jgi:hypothetical protein